MNRTKQDRQAATPWVSRGTTAARGGRRWLTVGGAALLVAVTAGPGYAQFGSKHTQQDDSPRVTVELLTEAPAIVPGGTTAVGLLFTIRDGWHTYAPNQNDTGTPARVEWSIEGGEGISISDLEWPAGERYVQPGEILDHVYEHEVLAVATISAPEDLEIGETITIRGELEWLVCSADLCVPEYGDVELTLPVAAAVRASPAPEWQRAFSAWEAGRGMAVTGHASEDVAVRWEGETLVVSTPHKADLSFMPIDDGAEVEELLSTGDSSNRTMRIRFADPSDRPRVHAWVRLSPIEGSEERPWRSDVWVLDTQFGRPPARIIGSPMVIPDGSGR